MKHQSEQRGVRIAVLARGHHQSNINLKTSNQKKQKKTQLQGGATIQRRRSVCQKPSSVPRVVLKPLWLCAESRDWNLPCSPPASLPLATSRDRAQSGVAFHRATPRFRMVLHEILHVVFVGAPSVQRTCGPAFLLTRSYIHRVLHSNWHCGPPTWQLSARLPLRLQTPWPHAHLNIPNLRYTNGHMRASVKQAYGPQRARYCSIRLHVVVGMSYLHMYVDMHHHLIKTLVHKVAAVCTDAFGCFDNQCGSASCVIRTRQVAPRVTKTLWNTEPRQWIGQEGCWCFERWEAEGFRKTVPSGPAVGFG